MPTPKQKQQRKYHYQIATTICVVSVILGAVDPASTYPYVGLILGVFYLLAIDIL